MITIRRAVQRDIPILGRKLLSLLGDKNSRFYQENVGKFGIPEEYVKRAFAEETLLEACTSGKADFYLAVENDEIIGFAQITQRECYVAELDRIVVFPQYARKGIGTQLLRKAIMDHKQKRVTTVIVKAGREETHARRFYEKNGFEKNRRRTNRCSLGRKDHSRYVSTSVIAECLSRYMSF